MQPVSERGLEAADADVGVPPVEVTRGAVPLAEDTGTEMPTGEESHVPLPTYHEEDLYTALTRASEAEERPQAADIPRDVPAWEPPPRVPDRVAVPSVEPETSEPVAAEPPDKPPAMSEAPVPSEVHRDNLPPRPEIRRAPGPELPTTPELTEQAGMVDEDMGESEYAPEARLTGQIQKPRVKAEPRRPATEMAARPVGAEAESPGEYSKGDTPAPATPPVHTHTPEVTPTAGEQTPEDAALLELLDLPPDTPIRRSGPPMVQMAPGAEERPIEQPAGESGTVRREKATEESTQVTSGIEPGTLSIERLARQVYRLVRERLRIERERRT